MTDVAVVPNLDTKIGRVNELDRYDRQQRIWGVEGQKRINDLKVAVVGDGVLARYVALPLAALGVGEIRLFGSSKADAPEMLLDVPVSGSRVEGCADVLKRLNPNVVVLPLSIDLESRVGQGFLQGVQVIVDATNDSRSKFLALSAAQAFGCRFISASTSGLKAKAICWPECTYRSNYGAEIFMPNFEGALQNSLVSLLWGGVVAEEVKKVAWDHFLSQRELHYRFIDKGKFSFGATSDVPVFDLSGKSLLVVGCGALGNMVVPALAYLGVDKVDFVDCDVFDSTNLNRQVLAYDCVGLRKSDVLAAKLRKMNPNVDARSLDMLFEIKDGKFSVEGVGREYDCVLSLVDNFYARAVIQAFAVKKGVALINAASSPSGCEVACFVPGKTSCLDHVHAGYYARGLKEEIVRRQSCAAEPDPSVVMTNQVAVGLAALELVRVLDSSLKPFNGVLKYTADGDFRLGENPVRSVCECYKHPELVPDLEIK